MKNKSLFFTATFTALAAFCFAQSQNAYTPPKWDYQIYLKQPAIEIKELQYNKDCSPVKGSLAPDGKTIIIKDYEKGKQVYVKVTYEDGTTEEFTRSSCYIDPLIL